MRYFPWLLAGWMLMARQVTLAEPAPESQDYLLRTWDVGDGLPSNTVPAIAQTPDGYLWVATWNGLARFDGNRFTLFSTKNLPGLESNRLSAAYVAGDGALWLGLEAGGVARLRGGRCETIVPRKAPSVGWTTSFARDKDGAVWFGHNADARVFRWRSGKITEFSGEGGVPSGFATMMSSGADGRLWYTTTDRCGFFDGTRFQTVDPGGGGGVRVTPARDGGVWAARDGKLLRYRDDGSRRVVADLGWMGNETSQVSTLLEDSAGDLWIGTTSAGLFRFREGGVVHVPSSHNGISCLFEDREKNLWVGTRGGGLDRLRPRLFYLRQVASGLHGDAVGSMCEDAAGRLWMVSPDGQPVRALDSENRTFATPPDYRDGAAYALCADPAGGIWSAGLFGLNYWNDGVEMGKIIRDPITGLLQDRAGDLWLAMISGPVVVQRNGANIILSEVPGMVDARALAEDHAGRIWVGTEGGAVFMQRDGKFIRVPLPGANPDEAIRFIVPDGSDSVWIGAYQGGLYRWRGGRVTRLPENMGFPLDDLRVLAIEPGGDFWIGTATGLFRVARGEIEGAIDGRLQSMRVVGYGRNDGLPSLEFSYGFRNSTVRTRDGHLWFGTYRGGLEVIPRKLERDTPPLAVIVEEIRAGGAVTPLPARGGTVFPPRTELVEINFTVPQLSAPEQMRFRYRLGGTGDEGWISTGNGRVATFTRLPHGQYRFEVAAAVADGPWLPRTASLDFTMAAEWWEAAWVLPAGILLGAVLLALLMRAVVKRRMLRRMKVLQQERALEKERSRIARDMHDQVGANLTQISLLSELASTPESVAELGAAARRAVDALDSIVWAVNPKKDTLASLLHYLVSFAEDFLNSADVRCRVDFSTDVPERHLPPEFRHHVFLVVKEALHNAVKYSHAGEVRLGAEFGQSHLIVTVSDNGAGFAKGADLERGNGLQNMRDRAAALGGECRIESHPHVGTRITLTAPWSATNPR